MEKEKDSLESGKREAEDFLNAENNVLCVHNIPHVTNPLIQLNRVRSKLYQHNRFQTGARIATLTATYDTTKGEASKVKAERGAASEEAKAVEKVPDMLLHYSTTYTCP